MVFPLRILLFLAIITGLIFLQVFLSGRESKLPGLILPGLFFLIALIYPLNMAAMPGTSTASLLLQAFLVWLLANIPTLILLAIYFSCRRKVQRKKQVEKMRIQDLD